MIDGIDTAAIKRRAVRSALALGAGAVRVAPAMASETARSRMAAAFSRGDFATWGYDAQYASDACDSRRLLRGARSVLCIALPYGTRNEKTPPLRGRVSNYAWSADYHRRIQIGRASCRERV